jgi:anti-sigma28 factor (negative regulator of flagellin synthesis)
VELNRIQQDLVRLYGGRSQGTRGPTGRQGPPGTANDEAQGASRADDVVLSDAAGAMRAAFSHVKSAPDVRETFVAELHSRVQSGDYRVPEDVLARRILDAGVLE